MLHLATSNVLLQGVNLERLLSGLWVAIYISLVSVLIGCIIGTILGFLRVKSFAPLQFLLRLYLELFRIIPILVWLYILYYTLPTAANINLDPQSVAIIVFAGWIAAEMSDIVRGSIISLPKHQTESAKALGLSTIQLYRYILLPQAIKRTLPSTINLITRVIKTTSLLYMLQIIEVIAVGKQIIENSSSQFPNASLWVYGFIFILYFAVCFPLSKIAQVLEKKWSV